MNKTNGEREKRIIEEYRKWREREGRCEKRIDRGREKEKEGGRERWRISGGGWRRCIVH